MQKIKGIAVTDSQAEVYSVLKTYGPVPDHALVPLAQHVSAVHLSSSGIRSRRVELLRKGLVKQNGTTTTGSGRTANIFQAVR